MLTRDSELISEYSDSELRSICMNILDYMDPSNQDKDAYIVLRSMIDMLNSALSHKKNHAEAYQVIAALV